MSLGTSATLQHSKTKIGIIKSIYDKVELGIMRVSSMCVSKNLKDTRTQTEMTLHLMSPKKVHQKCSFAKTTHSATEQCVDSKSQAINAIRILHGKKQYLWEQLSLIASI